MLISIGLWGALSLVLWFYIVTNYVRLSDLKCVWPILLEPLEGKEMQFFKFKWITYLWNPSWITRKHVLVDERKLCYDYARIWVFWQEWEASHADTTPNALPLHQRLEFAVKIEELSETRYNTKYTLPISESPTSTESVSTFPLSTS